MVTGLVVLPMGVVGLLWLSGSGPFRRPSQASPSPAVGVRMRPNQTVRGLDEPWLRRHPSEPDTRGEYLGEGVD